MIKKRIYALWAYLLISFPFFSQDTLIFNIPKKYGFENIIADTFSNVKPLDFFLAKLENQKNNNNTKVNIIHIGDSHLQADYISHTVRVALQEIFGNAGRGFISPLKISKSNEPFNYQTNSNINWKSSRCVSTKQTEPIGLGGMLIKTNDVNATIKIKTYNTDSLDYSFSRIKLYHLKNDSAYALKIVDTNKILLEKSESTFSTNYTFSKNTSNFTIHLQKSDSAQTNSVFYGAELENGKNGILYHSIGINGARYKNYSKSNEFCIQTASLNPDLIIISLGTNESFQKNYNSDVFYKEIDTLLTNLKKNNPKTPIILTTPANSFYYHHTNFNIPLVSKTITQYASDNNITIWDLYSITGGPNSAVSWKKSNLLSRDGIHYSKDGYIHQGNLLTKAFINAYNKYVSNR